jgi:diguanylate cyclase (GGDEF)-like protein
MQRKSAPPDSTEGSQSAPGGYLREALARARSLLDGELASYGGEERARIVAWQLKRAHRALAGIMATLALFAAIKVLMILAGAWTVAGHPGMYLALLLACFAAQQGYARAGTLTGEGVTATVFLLAFLALMIDPMTNWPDRPAKSLGVLLILPVLGMPLLVLLRSALLFAAFCILLAAGFLFMFPPEPEIRNALLLNLAIAVTAGLQLRMARSDMSTGFARSIREALLQATTDPLTGLLNRHGWAHAAAATLDSARDSGVPVSLLFLDLDHFKQLNDVHGHAEGDKALQRTGRALLARLQSGAIAARIGGEEFVCLLPGHSPEAVHVLAERVRGDLASASPVVRFSGGIARWNGVESLGRLMARADQALYRAKSEGRDRVLDAHDEGAPEVGSDRSTHAP